MSSAFFAVKAHILPAQYIRQYPGATLDSQEDSLRIHIKQYTPLDREQNRSNGITIIGTHANGFPKVCLFPSSFSGRDLLTIVGTIRAALG